MSCDDQLPALSLVPRTRDTVPGTSVLPVPEPVPEPEPAWFPEPEPADSGAGSGTSGAVVLAADLPGAEMTAGGRLMVLIAHWGRQAAAGSRRKGGLVHGLVTARPESLAQHRAYVKSEAWVPRGHEGSLIRVGGIVYGVTLGRLGVAIGNGVSAMFARPIRMAGVMLLALAVFLIAKFAS